MNPDCFPTSGEQTEGRHDALRRRERRMGGDRKVSEFAGAIFVQQKWRKMVIRGSLRAKGKYLSSTVF